MKKENLEVIKQKVLEILPICQSEIWKLGISGIKDHRDCSKIVKLLELEKKIKRTKFYDKDKKVTTYKVELSKLNGCGSRKKSYNALLNKDGKFSACCGCIDEEKGICDAIMCDKLIEWLRLNG